MLIKGGSRTVLVKLGNFRRLSPLSLHVALAQTWLLATFRRRCLPMDLEKKAVVLLSGGLDSATVLAIARDEGFTIHAMSFQYGQRHALSWTAPAHRVDGRRCKACGRARSIFGAFGGSALTGRHRRAQGPQHRRDARRRIPVTYVPARNTIFLSFALAWAEVLGVSDIFIGVNALDYSAATPTAGRSTSRPTSGWPTWPPGPASRDGQSLDDPHAADPPDQGPDHPARVWSWASITR